MIERIERTTLRIVLPSPDTRVPTPARVFRVADDGSEIELREVRSIDIRVRPDSIMSARVVLETYVSVPTRFSICVEGEIVHPSVIGARPPLVQCAPMTREPGQEI